MRSPSNLLIVTGIAVTAVAMSALLGARELQYMYHHNGHSLNPATYAVAAFSKVRLSHPIWHGRWSARHT